MNVFSDSFLIKNYVMNDSPDNPEGTTRGPAGTKNNGKGQLQR